MEIEVDADKCCGFGECVAVAPDLFDMGADNRAKLVAGGDTLVGALDRARAASFACPVEAIRVSE